MNDNQKITVAGDLIRIHLVITRAIEVSLEQTCLFTKKGEIVENLAEGFINYLRSLLSLFHSHHLVEDEQIFPYFQEHKLEAPYQMMNDQHQDLLPLLDNLENSINDWAKDVNNHQLISNLQKSLQQVQTLWIPHFQLEEEYLNEENIGSLISDEEQVKLAHQFGEYAAKHIKQDYLVIPFILFNLPAEERALMAEVFPAVVIEELVPHRWKDKWQSMSPFLLL